jgi:hypothetical protein
MPVDAERVRALALGLAGASEAPHFDRRSFKTPRKTFATLGPTGRDLNLMFDPELRDFYCEQEPAVFQPLAGGWGRMGCTRCDLDAVDEPTLVSAMQAAHRLAEPKPKVRRRS